MEKRLTKDKSELLGLESQRNLCATKMKILTADTANTDRTEGGSTDNEITSTVQIGIDATVSNGNNINSSESNTSAAERMNNDSSLVPSAEQPMESQQALQQQLDNLPNDPLFIESTLIQIQRSITESRARVSKTLAEEHYVTRQIMLETTHRQSATDWMQAMQGVMWPGNPEDLEIGRPLLPFQSTTSVSAVKSNTNMSDKQLISTAAGAWSSPTTTSCDDVLGSSPTVNFSMSNLQLLPTSSSAKPGPSGGSMTAAVAGKSSQQKQFTVFNHPTRLLPSGMEKAYEAAKALSIIEIEDVLLIFEAFRYMSWLNITLHCLRRPLPVVVLKLLLTSVQSFTSSSTAVSFAATVHPWVDEKLIKALSAIMTRAM